MTELSRSRTVWRCLRAVIMVALLTMAYPDAALACGSGECAYGEGCYSSGACLEVGPGQRCVCDSGGCYWVDDDACAGG